MRIFRLIPATIMTATLLLGVKIVDVMRGSETLLIESVGAQEEAKPANVSSEPPTAASPAKPEEAKKEAESKPDEKKSEEKAAPKAESVAEKSADTKKESKSGEGKSESKEKKNPNVSDKPGETADHRYTPVEVELLQSLSKRRDELDRWERNIQIKEAALEATEKHIDEKIVQIQGMKKEIAALLTQYNAQEDAKIKSLVKIYESMKPTEAARIFDELEMPVLLLVIDMMSEKKAAPILAAMNSKKAKQVTVELANERKVSSSRTDAATAATAAPSTAGASTPTSAPQSPVPSSPVQ